MSGFDAGVTGGGGTSSGATGDEYVATSALLAFGLVMLPWGSSSAANATTSTSADCVREPPAEFRGTSSGDGAMAVAIPSQGMLHDLRARSGLTWEQISRLLKVSRRSVHLWANGSTVTPANEEHMGRVLSVLRAADRGSPRETRAALLTPSPEGVVPFDLLADMRYEAALELLKSMRGRTRPRRPPLSEEALASRLPSPPDRLVGALHEPEQEAPRKSRVARAIRTRDRGGR